MIDLLRAVLRTLPEPAAVVSGEGEVLVANPALATLLGHPAAQLESTPIAEHLQAEPERFAAYLRTSVRSGDPMPGRARLARADGGVVDARCTAAALRGRALSGPPVLVLRFEAAEQSGAVFTELNSRLAELASVATALEAEKQQLEFRIARRTSALRARTAQLEESEARIRSIVETAVDGIITVTEDGRIDSFNSAAERMFGYGSIDAVGMPVAALFPLLQGGDAGAKPVPALLGSAEDTERAQHRELTAARKDGERFPVELALSRVALADRVIYSVIIRDITQRRLAAQQVDALTRQLMDASRQAGMAEIATGVLHNVGNVLNSVNVSTGVLADGLRKSRVTSLEKVAQLVADHGDDLGEFLTNDEAGRRVPGFLVELAKHLVSERDRLMAELQALLRNVEHIKTIVSVQHAYVGSQGVTEPISVEEIVDDALRINAAMLDRHTITVTKRIEEIEPILADRHRLLQILVNLLRNAKHAISDHDTQRREVTVTVARAGAEAITIEVADTGVGIPAEIIDKIFAHGFTTRTEGHGFGLHHSANAATEMGGALTVHSDGAGTGAVFTLSLPVRPTAATTEGGPG